MSEIKPCPEELPIGYVEAHCSEDDGIADVGVRLRLDGEQGIWCGEITREHAEEYDVDDAGWWLVWEIGKMQEPIARIADDYRARDFVDVLAAIIRDRDRASDACATVQRERDELREMLAEAVEALRPFAEACVHLHPASPNDGETIDGFKVSEFRRAGAFLARYEPSK